MEDKLCFESLTRPYDHSISTSQKTKAEKVIREFRKGCGSVAILNYLHFFTLSTFNYCWWLCLLLAPSPSCFGARARTPQRQLRPSQGSAPGCGLLPQKHLRLTPSSGLQACGACEVPEFAWNDTPTRGQPACLPCPDSHLPRSPPSHCWLRRFKPKAMWEDSPWWPVRAWGEPRVPSGRT